MYIRIVCLNSVTVSRCNATIVVFCSLTEPCCKVVIRTDGEDTFTYVKIGDTVSGNLCRSLTYVMEPSVRNSVCRFGEYYTITCINVSWNYRPYLMERILYNNKSIWMANTCFNLSKNSCTILFRLQIYLKHCYFCVSFKETFSKDHFPRSRDSIIGNFKNACYQTRNGPDSKIKNKQDFRKKRKNIRYPRVKLSDRNGVS